MLHERNPDHHQQFQPPQFHPQYVRIPEKNEFLMHWFLDYENFLPVRYRILLPMQLIRMYRNLYVVLPAAFNSAIQQREAQLKSYDKRATKFAQVEGDCIGTLPTNEQLAGAGFTAAICH